MFSNRAMNQLFASAACMALFAAHANANLLTNGSFELGTFVNDGNKTMTFTAGPTSVTGWTAVGRQVSWINSPNPWGLSAQDGNYFLDLTAYLAGAPFGGVTQNIATTIGQQYVLSFYLGSYTQVWGGPPVSILAAAGTANQTFTVSTTSAHSTWTPFSMTFTATSTTTVISLTGAAGVQYIGLDNVSVTAASGPDSNILPQLAFGEGWYSALYFTNTSANAVSFPVSFIGDDGIPLIVPSVGGSSTTVTLAPGATAIIEAPNAGLLRQGYVSLFLPDGVVGYGVFRASAPGRGDQEAVVPLSGVSATTCTLIWDDTNFVTAVAIVNPSGLNITVEITVRNTTGAVIGTASVPLAAKNKVAVTLRNLPGLGAMAGQRGSADFTVSSGNVAVLGLRFNAIAFTSIPTADR